MKMEDGLAGAGAIVEDGAIACQEIALAGELRSDQMELADDGLIFGRRVVQRNEMFARHKQDVRGRLRADVFEGKDVRVFINDF